MPTKEEQYDAAIELQQKGQTDEAIGELEKLIEQHADYALAHAALSVFHSRLEQHDKAVEYGQKVCELAPNDAAERWGHVFHAKAQRTGARKYD